MVVSVSANIDRAKARKEAVDMLYNNTAVGLIMTFVCFTAVTFGFDTTGDTATKHMLWWIMAGAVALRATDGMYFQFFLRNQPNASLGTLIRFGTGNVVTALIWATYVALLYDKMGTTEVSLTMVVVAALAGGSTAVLAPNRLIVVSYCSLMILPITFLALQDVRDGFQLLGFLGLMFWLAMVISSLRAHSFFYQAMSAKHHQDDMIDSMELEQQEVNRLNRELREANVKLDHANASLASEITRRTGDIHRLSNRDPLTTLMNRTGFLGILSTLFETAERIEGSVAILFIDLDGFKQVNDSLGHQVGDMVLAEVANRLSRFCEVDHIARWGGDEFVIVLPYANEVTAIAVAQAARGSVTNTIEVMENQISLDATIGIAMFPKHSNEPNLLVQLADLTMYEQKRQQPGSIGLFSEQLYEQLKREQQLREGLRHAVERQQLYLVYQPIVDSSNQSLWAVEALLRWQFFDEFVGPDKFIPLAEKAGMINDIGTWVLNRACIDAAQWPFKEVAVSVNVSIIQLLNDNFCNTVDKALRSSGLAPERLHLEITESVFADNKEKVIRQVNAIKSRKVSISIDDFGTGFSSLSQLQLLNFDHIKIDRTFVQNLEEGSDTIIRATLLIAREFGCTTVAEGIESEQDIERLRAMGVDCLQGYYFAKPLPVEQLRDWYDKHY